VRWVLVVNMIVLWNTIYMEAALNQLRLEGFHVYEADVARLLRLFTTTSTCWVGIHLRCPKSSRGANCGHCAIRAVD
jgi:Tn3 transposase DDE domain